MKLEHHHLVTKTIPGMGEAIDERRKALRLSVGELAAVHVAGVGDVNEWDAADLIARARG